MAKVKISEFNSNPALNTDIDSINIAEGCSPSGINDAIRELMSQLKDWQSGTSNDPYVVGSSGSLTLNQGTANTVPYLNGSKVVTSGTALSFDGTNLGLGVTPSAWYTTSKALELGSYASISGSGTTGYANISNNAYQSSGSAWAYKVTDKAALYSLTNGSHAWYYAASGTAGNTITFTQAMTLDASGNLGIGTTSPSTKLDITYSANARGGIRLFSNNNSGTSEQAGLLALNGNSVGLFAGVNGAAYTTGGIGGANGAVIYSVGNQALAFGVNTTEAARIDTSGNLLVGTTSNLAVTPRVAIVASNFGLAINTTNGGSNEAVRFYNASTAVGTITTTGSATAYNTSSDYRLKNTITPMTGALAKVAQLKPCTYKWNADGSDGEGFIAHELAEVCPDAVVGEKDAVDAEGNPKYQGIDVSFLVATLTAAIQEQQAIIESLTARLDAANL